MKTFYKIFIIALFLSRSYAVSPICSDDLRTDPFKETYKILAPTCMEDCLKLADKLCESKPQNFVSYQDLYKCFINFCNFKQIYPASLTLQSFEKADPILAEVQTNSPLNKYNPNSWDCNIKKTLLYLGYLKQITTTIDDVYPYESGALTIITNNFKKSLHISKSTQSFPQAIVRLYSFDKGNDFYYWLNIHNTFNKNIDDMMFVKYPLAGCLMFFGLFSETMGYIFACANQEFIDESTDEIKSRADFKTNQALLFNWFKNSDRINNNQDYPIPDRYLQSLLFIKEFVKSSNITFSDKPYCHLGLIKIDETTKHEDSCEESYEDSRDN